MAKNINKVLQSQAKKSIEEKVEDLFKKELIDNGIKYFTKNEFMNDEIDKALKESPSKTGNNGGNYPDIRCLIETKTLRRIPVMIEVKGIKGYLIKYDGNDGIELASKYLKDTKTHKMGDINYSSVEKYAVNGALHYGNIILEKTNYTEVIIVGINGYYNENNSITKECLVYYVSKKNMCIPKLLKEYKDLTFLRTDNLDGLVNQIDSAQINERDIEAQTKTVEIELDGKLKAINQLLQDTLQINVNHRVNLIIGMIIAGLGVDNVVPPLKPSELQSLSGDRQNDGYKILDKIDAFLAVKNIPNDKKVLIKSILQPVFSSNSLCEPVNGISKLKTIYTMIYEEIMPIFNQPYHLDFTGKLFNVLNQWVSVPDGDKNDVVLTPRYITELMAKLCRVNMNSYVWDYCTGSAGFLVSSMKLMLQDAKTIYGETNEYKRKENKIKTEQLLGIEKLSDIYMLAVLNMILMKDGSTNILHEDSLKDFDGKYAYGKDSDGKELGGRVFPANVFLLNPPYSADGKGMIFVKKALDKMNTGKAAILIQENAGAGMGGTYTQDILKRNTLLASIHLADIFCGKAGVQTAIYLFDVGTPHNQKQKVKFIDFSNDGYERQNRKKSDLSVNLKNVDHATERYEEVLNLVLYGKEYLHYLSDNEYIEDTITLNGDDWTFNQHYKLDTSTNEQEIKKVVKDYLSWIIGSKLRGEF